MEAIVLAGGLGTRLQSVITDIPKPMAPISGKPFLYFILKWLEKNAISRVILSVGYKWETIKTVFGDQFNTMELIYSVEDTPLGTGGAIALAMDKLTSDQFFIINGDTFFEIELGQLLVFHQFNKFDFSIALKPMTHFERYGTVELNNEGRITQFNEKEPKEEGYINAGIYIANKSIQESFPKQSKFSFEKEFMETHCEQLVFGGLPQDHYFIDIGIPEDYSRAQQELPQG